MNIINRLKNIWLKFIFKTKYCHYIHGPETLPPPFTTEEENEISQFESFNHLILDIRN